MTEILSWPESGGLPAYLSLDLEAYGRGLQQSPGCPRIGWRHDDNSWVAGDRSRVQQFVGPVRWGWQTAGALDALLEGHTEECKARPVPVCLGSELPGRGKLGASPGDAPGASAAADKLRQAQGPGDGRKPTGRRSWTAGGIPP